MEFIGLKNVGQKLESRVSRFFDIYLSNATMIVLHGQGGGGWTLRSQKKIMKCTNDISDFLKDPQTLVLEGSLLVSTLKNFAGILSKTQHGHHVIMHCLRRFSNNLTKDLVEEIAVNTVDLATNKSGCCVLQHCLEHVREGEQKRRLIAEIIANDLFLSGDSFGSHKEKRSSYPPEKGLLIARRWNL